MTKFTIVINQWLIWISQKTNTTKEHKTNTMKLLLSTCKESTYSNRLGYFHSITTYKITDELQPRRTVFLPKNVALSECYVYMLLNDMLTSNAGTINWTVMNEMMTIKMKKYGVNDRDTKRPSQQGGCPISVC